MRRRRMMMKMKTTKMMMLEKEEYDIMKDRKNLVEKNTENRKVFLIMRKIKKLK